MKTRAPRRIQSSALRGALLAGSAALALCACTPVPTVTPDPVPSAERLRKEDCAPAAAAYRQRLDVMQPKQQGAWDPAGLQAEFQKECEARLAGQARRAVIRCWKDAPTAADFLKCNERF